MLNHAMLARPQELLEDHGAVVIDCRFSLADPLEGERLYQEGHVPGAHYLDLDRELSGPVGLHGGRHPLPDPAAFAARLAALGVDRDTTVVAYDDSRLAFCARLWWLMRSLGYRPPRLLDGGYQGFLAAGGEPQVGVPAAAAVNPPSGLAFAGFCDIEGVRGAQAEGAVLVDSREEKRYLGIEEPIDPVAGHIPGAINRPWLGVTDARGWVASEAAQSSHWGDTLEADQLVVYCGSGVTACVNLFSLALLGREEATLYAGSWSDWCSYL
jgi:thiosulfate/3-mercaptopyruvate sulfurtransferase